ncbi:ABC transporter G family member 1 isoform X2 [Hevea brasiliensis]|uniref:ABC transporter G family member 1 isoform X2 n=1 Tax=Hevea brasiliensis TaxID=3981 RepID=UPI0025DB8568|nr:ABC transporter G family member 1 isoform X2 [Hevea brasiliensis]
MICMASSPCLQPQVLNQSENSNNVMVSLGAEPETVQHSPDVDKGHAGMSCWNHRNDIFLTWEELGVTVPSKKHNCKWILQGFTGYAQPGEILAIMGPSGCGKTTLLDALAGRLDSSTKQTGQVLINGHKQNLAYGTSAYVSQDDVITWTLTVREAVFYSALLQLPNSMSLTEKKERAEMTIKEMGLQDSIDTRIGGWGSKGLSGGQKRRVSICIEILTRPKLLFLDEPTSGLDSAASYYVMKKLANLAKQHGMTVIASIHQPGSDVFQLFHSLCLLSSGRTIYFGPSTAANKFFEMNGLPCPSHQNPSDHYLRTINTDFDEDMEQGFGAKKDREEVINLLVRSYKSSATCRQIQRRVREICRQEKTELNKGSQVNFITQSLVLSRRSFVNMYRDLGYYWLRLAIYIMLGLGLGSVFYRIGTGYSSIQVGKRITANVHCFFIDNNGNRRLPFICRGHEGAITYCLVGLQQGSEHFIYFALILFACMMLVESLMLIVASIVPNFLMGLITGAGIQGLMMLSGGFFRLPDDLPTVLWRYPLYYIAFHKYAYQGLYKNEFQGLTFPPSDHGGPPYINGEEILRNIWQVEMSYSKWIDLAILFGMVVVYRLVLLCVLGITEKFKPFVREIKFVSLNQAKKILANPYCKPSDEVR